MKDGLNYPIRKNHHKYLCKKCGKILKYKAEYCLECRRFLDRVVERPPREKLKDLIRTTAFTTIGKMYNVSDNSIRKWCIAYNLPSKVKDIKIYSDEEWNNI